MPERPWVWEIGDDEGQRLVRIVRRGTGSVVCVLPFCYALSPRLLLVAGEFSCRRCLGVAPSGPRAETGDAG